MAMVNYLELKKVSDSFQPELSATIEKVVQSGWYLFGEEKKAFDELGFQWFFDVRQ